MKVIDELRSVEESNGKRQKFCVWTPTQRAELASTLQNMVTHLLLEP